MFISNSSHKESGFFQLAGFFGIGVIALHFSDYNLIIVCSNL